MSKKKIGLVPKLIIGIIAGILIGSFAPEFLVKALVTASSLFSAFLKFVIPFIIIGFVTAGIADLATGAGKLLGVTTGIAYGSTIVAGTLAFIVASLIFPSFIDPSVASQIGDPEAGMLEPIFTIPLSPMVDVTAAIVFSFTMGLGISALRNNDKGEILYNLFQEFQEIITKVLSTIIIPLLPIYIAGTFANITYAGQVWNILSIFWRVYLVVIPLHIVYLIIQFTTAGFVTGKNPLKMLKNQIPGYLTAVGTQSSAATIPVTLQCVKKNEVSEEVLDFVVPLVATIHLAGDTITLVLTSMAVMYMNGQTPTFGMIMPFIFMLGVTMIAAPGVPGGGVMAALGLLESMLGFGAVEKPIMIALHAAQDSFGTATNVTGDGAIAIVVDYIINKRNNKKEEESKLKAV